MRESVLLGTLRPPSPPCPVGRPASNPALGGVKKKKLGVFPEPPLTRPPGILVRALEEVKTELLFLAPKFVP